MKPMILSFDRLTPRQQEMLDDLQYKSFRYFLDHTNPSNGLVADSTWPNSPASIAAVGYALPVYAVASERGWMSRLQAAESTLATLRFLSSGSGGPEPSSLGWNGFFYHFLDREDGQRVWECELSTIDTSILLAGILAAATYFDRDTPGETEIRSMASDLYGKANWLWALDRGVTVSHGWKPESGFLPYRWQGYDETLLLHILGLGSPTYPLPESTYSAWTSSFQWKELFGVEYLHAAPLFIHHASHIWIDFRGLQDRYMRRMGLDYFENSRRAVLIHQRYCMQNAQHFVGYSELAWGITASEGPVRGPGFVEQDGYRFFGYLARGVPGPDDGTLSPWTVITSLPFAPEIAVASIEHYLDAYPQLAGEYGMMCSLNPTFTAEPGGEKGWYSNNYYGLNEGPVVLMIENFRNGFVWELMKKCIPVRKGLQRGGFSGGWL